MDISTSNVEGRSKKIEEYHQKIQEIAQKVCTHFNIQLRHNTLVDATLEIRKLVKMGKISQQVEQILWDTNANQELFENGNYIDKIFLEAEENIKKLTEELKGVLC